MMVQRKMKRTGNNSWMSGIDRRLKERKARRKERQEQQDEERLQRNWLARE